VVEALRGIAEDPHHLFVHLFLLMRLLNLLLMQSLIVERAACSCLLALLVDPRLADGQAVLIDHALDSLEVRLELTSNKVPVRRSFKVAVAVVEVMFRKDPFGRIHDRCLLLRLWRKVPHFQASRVQCSILIVLIRHLFDSLRNDACVEWTLVSDSVAELPVLGS